MVAAVKQESAPPSAPEVNPQAGRGRAWLPFAISLGVIGAALLGGLLMLRAVVAETSVTITNVGVGPAEGIELLAVSELSSDVRHAWPVGDIPPGGARTIEGIFVPDAHLAIRLRRSVGETRVYRLRIYVGSPRTKHVRLDVGGGGLVRAHVHASGWEETLAGDQIREGLEPWLPQRPSDTEPR